MAPRIVIFGAGSIGAAYTWVLSRKVPERDIVAICRSNYDAASKAGFTLNSSIWGQNLVCRPVVVKSVEEAAAIEQSAPFDYVVICSKAIPSTPSIAELIRPLVSQHTAVVLIQNGISIEDEYARAYPENPILSTVVYFPATQTAPAVIKHTETELLHVGTFPTHSPVEHKKVASTFVELITDCGATAKLHDDIQAQRWAKLVLNTALNPICALSQSTDSHFLASGEDALDFVKDTFCEVAAVAQACGYNNVNQDLLDTCVDRISHRVPPGVQPSMMADALAGRSLEVDAIVGNVVKLAREKGVNVPILRTLHNLARALDDSFTRSRGTSFRG